MQGGSSTQSSAAVFVPGPGGGSIQGIKTEKVEAEEPARRGGNIAKRDSEARASPPAKVRYRTTLQDIMH